MSVEDLFPVTRQIAEKAAAFKASRQATDVPEQWAAKEDPTAWTSLQATPTVAPWMAQQQQLQAQRATSDAAASSDPLARAAAQGTLQQQGGTLSAARRTGLAIQSAQERAAMDQYNAALLEAQRKEMMQRYGMGIDYASGLGGVQTGYVTGQSSMSAAQQAANAQLWGGILSGAGQAGMYAVTAKNNEQPPASPATSDARAKRISKAADRAALAWLDGVEPKAFTYRDPERQMSRGVDGGKQDWPVDRPMLGVTTQELSRSKVGEQMVREGEDGYEQIDPSAAIGPLIAAVAALKRKVG